MIPRTHSFVNRVSDFSGRLMKLYQEAPGLFEEYIREYTDGKDSDLALIHDELSDRGFDDVDIKNAMNQGFAPFAQFMDGTASPPSHKRSVEMIRIANY